MVPARLLLYDFLSSQQWQCNRSTDRKRKRLCRQKLGLFQYLGKIIDTQHAIKRIEFLWRCMYDFFNKSVFEGREDKEVGIKIANQVRFFVEEESKNICLKYGDILD